MNCDKLISNILEIPYDHTITNNLNEINQILIKLKEEYKYNPNKGTKMNLTVMENQKRNIVLKLWLLKDKNVKENNIKLIQLLWGFFHHDKVSYCV